MWRRRLPSSLVVILLFANTWIELGKSNRCSRRLTSECRRKRPGFRRMSCGNYTLRRRRTSDVTSITSWPSLLELPHRTDCSNIGEMSISSDFEVDFNTSNDDYLWKINYDTIKNVADATHILFTASNRTRFTEQRLKNGSALKIFGYILQDLALEFYKPSVQSKDESNTKLIPVKRRAHNVQIIFNVTGDRELDKFSLSRTWLVHDTTQLQCVKWNNGGWTKDNCRSISNTSLLEITCECDFQEGQNVKMAVLTTVEGLPDSQPAMPVYFSLTLISTLFFVATLVLLLRFRKGLKDANRRFEVQLNLTVSLLLRHTFLLIGFGISLFNPLDRKGCEAMAVLHLYFLVTSVLWVLTEGVIIYRKICKSSLTRSLTKLIINAVLVWGLPFLLLAGVSAYELMNDSFIIPTESYLVIKKRLRSVFSDTEIRSAELLNYRKYDFCWTTSRFASFALGIPVTVSLVINTIILILVGVVVWKIRVADTKNTPAGSGNECNGSFNQTKSTFRAVVLLTAMLGIPWLFSLLFNLIEGILKRETLAPSYVHFSFLFLQGPALFYLYCIQNHDFRRAFQRSVDTQRIKKSIAGSQQASQQALNHESV